MILKMLEVIKGSISSDISGLSQGEFTNLVKDTLDCVHAKQEEELKKQQEECEEQAKKLADALYQKQQQAILRKQKEDEEKEHEALCQIEIQKEKEMIKEWEVLVKLEWEIKEKLEKKKEQTYMDKLKKKYGHSLEINLQKEMDMSIPEHLLNPASEVLVKDLWFYQYTINILLQKNIEYFSKSCWEVC